MTISWQHIVVLIGALVAVGLVSRSCESGLPTVPASKQPVQASGSTDIAPETAALPELTEREATVARPDTERVAIASPSEEDGTSARIAKCKAQSKWGPMSDEAMSDLLDMLSNRERRLQESHRRFLEQGGQLHSKKNAEYIENIQATLAKMDALLAGSYVLMKDEQPPMEVWGDPYIHVVHTSGVFAKQESNVSLSAWILIDLREFPLYVEARANLRALAEAEANMTRFR